MSDLVTFDLLVFLQDFPFLGVLILFLDCKIKKKV